MTTPTNLEKENKSGQNQDGYDANKPLRILTASSIIGDKIQNKKEEAIGEIKDIMINLIDGKIDYVVVEFGGFLGIGEKLFAIPFSAMKLNAIKEVFVLDIEKSFLEKAPGFDKNHWPETNNHYYGVNVYWGAFMGGNTGI